MPQENEKQLAGKTNTKKQLAGKQITLAEYLEDILIDDQIPKLLAVYQVNEEYPGKSPTPAQTLAWAMIKGIVNMSKVQYFDPNKAQTLKTVK